MTKMQSQKFESSKIKIMIQQSDDNDPLPNTDQASSISTAMKEPAANDAYVYKLEQPSLTKRQMSHGETQLQNRLHRLLVDPKSQRNLLLAPIMASNDVDTPTFQPTEQTSNSASSPLGACVAMAAAPSLGLKRSTSIIEKLTNFTYTSLERDEDNTLVQCMKRQASVVTPLQEAASPTIDLYSVISQQ